jgi:hypothetical protein
MDILGPMPKTFSNPVPQLIKSATARSLLLSANLTILPESILPYAHEFPHVNIPPLLIPPSPTPAITPLPALVPVRDPSFNVLFSLD